MGHCNGASCGACWSISACTRAGSCLRTQVRCMCSCATCLFLKDLLHNIHVYLPSCVVSGVTSCRIGKRLLCAEFLCDCRAKLVLKPFWQLSQKRLVGFGVHIFSVDFFQVRFRL